MQFYPRPKPRVLTSKFKTNEVFRVCYNYNIHLFQVQLAALTLNEIVVLSQLYVKGDLSKRTRVYYCLVLDFTRLEISVLNSVKVEKLS